MHIRPATLDDIPAIMDLICQVVPAMRAAGNLQWDDTYPNPEVFLQDIALGQLWLATVKNPAKAPGNVQTDVHTDLQIAGVIAITTDQSPEYAQVGWDIHHPSIVVHRLAVHPAFKGNGIAQALMRHAEEIAHTRNLLTLRVDTNTANQATQHLFPKLGYRLAGEITLDFRPGLRFYCYEKQLSPT